MNHCPALLMFCVSLAALLPAQDPDKAGKITPVAGATEENADEKAQAGELDGSSGADVKGRPTGRTDLPRFCDFIGSARPSPLPPGASGTFNVIAVLKGDGVITDATKVQLDYQRQQGPLMLGEPIWPAARPGKLAAAFQGRPVFEDTLVVSIPLSVAAGTPFGTYPLQATVTATLSQGSNGSALGELRTLVTAQAKVGDAVLGTVPGRGAAPAPAPPPPAAASADAQHQVKPGADAARAATPPAAGSQPVGQALDPQVSRPDDAGSDHGPTDLQPLPDRDGMPMLLLLGGGFVLLVGLVLVLARKK